MPHKPDLSDVDLIKIVKETQDSGALTELVNRNTGIYCEIISRYTYVPAIERQDLVDHKFFNIYKYALSYDPNRNMKFSVFVGQQIKYECKTLLTNKVDTEEVSETLPSAPIKSSGIDLVKFIEDNSADISDQRFLPIFKMRHMDKESRSWKYIGRKLSITHEWARQIYNYNIKFLRNRISKELNPEPVCN